MPTTVTIPGEETSYRILIKSEIKSEQKRLLSSVLFTAARKIHVFSHCVMTSALQRPLTDQGENSTEAYRGEFISLLGLFTAA